ncbi:hypothetical protein [Flavihumibacter fluvii]|uniref:hypothetical protein n=1 Tax=Flavihumibacter fluvii TaxID=2838157 RepID=UPI001BDE4716|nr:hypothetical protein [Flavihumibacter fluvii]ULQ51309.1 hypothetical protein KJS93_14555 [Flavihumibacter fluvii]
MANSITDTISRNSLLYNGVEYTKKVNYFNENAFFKGEEFFTGDVHYTGNLYKQVQLQYDCIDDLVLLKDPLRARRMVLIKEKVDAFTIEGHHFIKLEWLGEKGEFYEQLYKGKRTVLVQWKKNIVRDMTLQERYILVKTIYLLEGKNLTRITKASDLTNLMGDKKRKVQQFYRENNLSFKRDPATATVKLVEKGEVEGW